MSKLFLVMLVSLVTAGPVAAQDALSSRADTGTTGGWSDGTAGNDNGPSSNTRTGNPGLPMVSSSSPLKGGYAAPGNFALRQLGKNSLPPTRLNSFVRQGGEAVFGDEGIFLPPFDSFTEEHRIERAMERNPDLTTNHRISGPSAWDFPN